MGGMKATEIHPADAVHSPNRSVVMKLVVAVVLSVCLALAHRAAATGTKIADVWSTYGTFSAVNADPVVSASFGICSTSDACPVAAVGATIGPAFSTWSDIKTKLHDSNSWITLSYVWGTSPNTVAHINTHFQVSRLFDTYGLSQPGGESWNAYKSVSSFGSYDFDEIDFPLTMWKQNLPLFAPTPYYYQVTHGGLTIYGHTVPGAGSESVPEPASWVLCMGLLACALLRRR